MRYDGIYLISHFQLCHPVRPTPVRMEELAESADQPFPALVPMAMEEQLVQVRTRRI